LELCCDRGKYDAVIDEEQESYEVCLKLEKEADEKFAFNTEWQMCWRTEILRECMADEKIACSVVDGGS
jgi:hypothetical protein